MASRNDIPFLITLQWIALILALFVTAVSIYDLVSGENNLTTWFSLILWPVVAVLNILLLARLNRRTQVDH